MKAKVKKAMTYPAAVLVVAFVVSGILLIKVVPQFEKVFVGIGAELPAFAQFVIRISEFTQEWWYVMIGGVVGPIFLFMAIHKRSKKLRDTLDRLLLKAPVAGSIIEKSPVARFARTLSTTFTAGVPLVEELNSVAGATGNSVYTNAVYQVRDDVNKGQQLRRTGGQRGKQPNLTDGTLDYVCAQRARGWPDHRHVSTHLPTGRRRRQLIPLPTLPTPLPGTEEE
jgi:type IV pilus assembly protein PilC